MHPQSRRNIVVASFDVAIALVVEGSESYIDAVLDSSFWHEFVPGFSFSNSPNPDQRWTIREDDNPRFDLKNHVVHAPATAITPVIVIIEAEFERLRQERALYTLHGSYIGKNTSAIGFIGAISGIGKTTICAHSTKHGWEWLGDEKFTLTTDGEVIGGVTSILNDSKTHTSSDGLRPTKNSSVRTLRLVCIPLVTNEAVATVHKLDQARRQWQYYDETTRDIRQINGVLRGFSTPLPSYDSNSLAKKRQEAAARFSDLIPIISIRGSKEAILESIESYLANGVQAIGKRRN